MQVAECNRRHFKFPGKKKITTENICCKVGPDFFRCHRISEFYQTLSFLGNRRCLQIHEDSFFEAPRLMADVKHCRKN